MSTKVATYFSYLYLTTHLLHYPQRTYYLLHTNCLLLHCLLHASYYVPILLGDEMGRVVAIAGGVQCVVSSLLGNGRPRGMVVANVFKK